jgi:hypothetical protein
MGASSVWLNWTLVIWEDISRQNGFFAPVLLLPWGVASGLVCFFKFKLSP